MWIQDKTEIIVIGDVDTQLVEYLNGLSPLNVQVAHPGMTPENPLYINFSKDRKIHWPDYLPIDSGSVVLKPDDVFAML